MKTMSRQTAVAAIRQELIKLVDDEHSMCQVAADKRIFCHGFAQWSDSELTRRLRWLVERRHPGSRVELEQLANRWELQRQSVLDVPLACDVQRIDRDQCLGFDTFSDRQLEEHYRDLLGEEVKIEGA